MTISGSSPLGAAARVANAYGIAPRTVSRPVEAAGIPLSSVLNDEERAYFDQLEAMGPITYGRTGTGGMVPEAPRGVRLDVRG